MKIYNVSNRENNYFENFYNLTDAKRAMVEHNATGIIYKIYSNGDMVNCGEIKLKGNNKTFIANTQQTVKGY